MKLNNTISVIIARLAERGIIAFYTYFFKFKTLLWNLQNTGITQVMRLSASLSCLKTGFPSMLLRYDPHQVSACGITVLDWYSPGVRHTSRFPPQIQTTNFHQRWARCVYRASQYASTTWLYTCTPESTLRYFYFYYALFVQQCVDHIYYHVNQLFCFPSLWTCTN